MLILFSKAILYVLFTSSGVIVAVMIIVPLSFIPGDSCFTTSSTCLPFMTITNTTSLYSPTSETLLAAKPPLLIISFRQSSLRSYPIVSYPVLITFLAIPIPILPKPIIPIFLIIYIFSVFI